jgi:hypothetical protein
VTPISRLAEGSVGVRIWCGQNEDARGLIMPPSVDDRATSRTTPEAGDADAGPAVAPAYVPTSVHLARLLDDAEGTEVSVRWLIDALGERSFGLTLLMMALIAFVPGASTLVGVLIAWPAIQMILRHDAPVLPRFIARRQIAVEKLARAIRIVTPRLRWVEKAIRPRWPGGFRATRRLTGFLMLLLGITMMSPFPFSHVIPAIIIMLLALAYLEEDGIILLIALTAAVASLAVTAAALWGVVATANWLDRL